MMVPMVMMFMVMMMIGDVTATLFTDGTHCLAGHCIVVAGAAAYIHLNGGRFGRGCRATAFVENTETF